MRTRLDVLSRTCTGPIRCVRFVHVGLRVWTCFHVPLPALFPCVRFMNVCGGVLTCFHVPVPAVFSVYALCTCVYSSGRAFAYRYRPYSVCTFCARGFTRLDVLPRTSTGLFSVCTLYERVCTRLNVLPRTCTGSFQCVRPLHQCVLVWTCFHVHVSALFGVYALCTCVYASGRASTWLYRPFSESTLCARVFTRVDLHSRACTGPFR